MVSVLFEASFVMDDIFRTRDLSDLFNTDPVGSLSKSLGRKTLSQFHECLSALLLNSFR